MIEVTALSIAYAALLAPKRFVVLFYFFWGHRSREMKLVRVHCQELHLRQGLCRSGVCDGISFDHDHLARFASDYSATGNYYLTGIPHLQARSIAHAAHLAPQSF